MTSHSVGTAFLQSSSAGSPDPILLEAEETTIGRDPSCQVVLSDASGVSRRHVTIRHRGQVFAIADLGSSNGTFVNGQRLQAEQFLKSGDRIQLSAQGPEFTFVDPAAKNVPAATQIDFPSNNSSGNAAPPTVIGTPISPANPARLTNPQPIQTPQPHTPQLHTPQLHTPQLHTPQLHTPPASGGILKWALIGGGVVIGGIGLLIVLRISTVLLGGGLGTRSNNQPSNQPNNQPASPQQPTSQQPSKTSTPQAPSTSEPQASSSATPDVEESFVCDSPEQKACTSDTRSLTRNSTIAFTVFYKKPLDTSTKFRPSVDYTSPQGEQKHIDLPSQNFNSVVQYVTVPLGKPDGGWRSGTYQLSLEAKNAAGGTTRTQTVTIR